MGLEVPHVGRRPGEGVALPAPAGRAAGEAAGFQVEVLTRELEDAVAVENFERAAALRDELSRLRGPAGRG